MTTLSNDTPRAYELGEFNECPAVASDIIYEGAAVGENGSGYGRPLVGGDRFLGFSERQCDNSAGAAGAKRVRYRRKGQIQLSITGAVITDVGQPVYATDDDTFTLLPTGGTYIGNISRFVSSGVAVVDFDADRQDPYGTNTRETLSDDKTLDAEDSGKVFFMTVDAKTVTLPAVEGMAGITVVNMAADGTVLVTVAPNAADMIEGPDITGADNKGLLNTKATARRGDFIKLEYSDANGWVVIDKRGTWARAA